MGYRSMVGLTVAIGAYLLGSILHVGGQRCPPGSPGCNDGDGCQSGMCDTGKRRLAVQESWTLQTDKDETLAHRNGYIFQTEGCPQAISEEEALQQREDDSLPGNVVELKDFIRHGGTGNHFLELSGYLSMAFCCKSKLLTLPGVSDQIPTEDGEEFRPTQRWFDFSNSSPPPAYAHLAKRSDICIENLKYNGTSGYVFRDVQDPLMKCMHHVFMRGCEVAYLGDLIRPDRHCPKKEGTRALQGWEGGGQEGGEGQSLVMHVRSGDIFDKSKLLKKYGQPPLQFYLAAIGHQAWSDVSIVTYSPHKKWLNPTFVLLDSMVRMGALGPHVKTHMNRNLLDDVHDFLCADALAISKSTLHLLSLAHTKATTFFIPSECKPNTSKFKLRFYVESIRSIAPLVMMERPEAKVYGLEWDSSRYHVYGGWNNTLEQYWEMFVDNSVEGMEECSMGSWKHHAP